jgi:hypothetical protein
MARSGRAYQYQRPVRDLVGGQGQRHGRPAEHAQGRHERRRRQVDRPPPHARHLGHQTQEVAVRAIAVRRAEDVALAARAAFLDCPEPLDDVARVEVVDAARHRHAEGAPRYCSTMKVEIR